MVLLRSAKNRINQDITIFKKQNQRCISADVIIQPKKELKNSNNDQNNSNEQSKKTQFNSTLANTNELNLTCEEEVQFDEDQRGDNNKTINKSIQEVEMGIDDDDENQKGFDAETIKFLVQRERDYMPDPHYIENKQSNVSWMMRAILLDWMMEVCTEFHMKRETYNLSLQYVDLYLSKAEEIQK